MKHLTKTKEQNKTQKQHGADRKSRQHTTHIKINTPKNICLNMKIQTYHNPNTTQTNTTTYKKHKNNGTFKQTYKRTQIQHIKT